MKALFTVLCLTSFLIENSEAMKKKNLFKNQVKGQLEQQLTSKNSENSELARLINFEEKDLLEIIRANEIARKREQELQEIISEAKKEVEGLEERNEKTERTVIQLLHSPQLMSRRAPMTTLENPAPHPSHLEPVILEIPVIGTGETILDYRHYPKVDFTNIPWESLSFHFEGYEYNKVNLETKTLYLRNVIGELPRDVLLMPNIETIILENTDRITSLEQLFTLGKLGKLKQIRLSDSNELTDESINDLKRIVGKVTKQATDDSGTTIFEGNVDLLVEKTVGEELRQKLVQKLTDDSITEDYSK